MAKIEWHFQNRPLLIILLGNMYIYLRTYYYLLPTYIQRARLIKITFYLLKSDKFKFSNSLQF